MGETQTRMFYCSVSLCGTITDGGLNPTVLSSWTYCNCSTEVCTLPAEFLHLVGTACAWVNMWNDIKIIRLKNTKNKNKMRCSEIAEDYEAYSWGLISKRSLKSELSLTNIQNPWSWASQFQIQTRAMTQIFKLYLDVFKHGFCFNSLAKAIKRGIKQILTPVDRVFNNIQYMCLKKQILQRFSHSVEVESHRRCFLVWLQSVI